MIRIIDWLLPEEDIGAWGCHLLNGFAGIETFVSKISKILITFFDVSYIFLYFLYFISTDVFLDVACLSCYFVFFVTFCIQMFC
jgi:hypothetical protein